MSRSNNKINNSESHQKTEDLEKDDQKEEENQKNSSAIELNISKNEDAKSGLGNIQSILSPSPVKNRSEHPQNEENITVDKIIKEIKSQNSEENEGILENKDDYEFYKTKLDIENFIDYHILEMYLKNFDWPANNIDAWKEKNEEGKWKWLFYDIDAAFGDYNYNMFKHMKV